MQLNDKGHLNKKGKLVRKSGDVLIRILAEGREVSILTLPKIKSNSQRQFNDTGEFGNEGQFNNKGQLNDEGQLVKKCSGAFLIAWPKAGKLANSGSSAVAISHRRKLNSEGQLNNKKQPTNKGQLNDKGQLINKKQ